LGGYAKFIIILEKLNYYFRDIYMIKQIRLTSYVSHLTSHIAALLFILIFSGNAFAQQIQTIPITPQIPSGFAQPLPPIQGQWPTLQQPPPQPPQPAQPPVTTPQQEAQPVQPIQQQVAIPQLEIEGLSEFEQFVAGRLPQEVSTNIRQFGYDLFRQPTTFVPVENVPVGPEYVIGPGDGIRINVWGRIEGEWNVIVGRDGNIAIPRIGVLGVTGLTFKELKEMLHKEFSKYYTGFEMNVSMGQLRTIRVYVVGNAERPGAYTVSSLSTLVSALFEAGGPSKTGTMRDIQVKRNGRTIVHFDIYNFLLKGDKTKDIRLMPEDVIFIPPVGPLVGIAGKVKSPAIYELKGETKISDLISMADGLQASAYLQRMQVKRIFEHEVKIILDISLKDITKDSNITLKDGDIVKIFPIIDVVINAVTLQGNVTRPGQYQWFDGMRVSDLIKKPHEDLLPETYFEHALIERYVPPSYHRKVIFFNLGKVLFEKDKGEDKILMPHDSITIYNKWQLIEKPIVRIAGAIHKPSEYELRKKMRVSDLVKLAGGPKYFAYLKEAELTRLTPTPGGPVTEKIRISIERALQDDPEHNILLRQNDYLFVRAVPEWELYRTVTISGEVRFPGTYTIKRGERLSSLIERAGGYTDKAFLRGAVFTRERVRELQQRQLDEMVERLERELLGRGAAEVVAALSPEEAKLEEIEIRQKRDFIAALKGVRAKGRMVIKIDQPEILKKTHYDVVLEKDDSLFIPSDPQSIQVIGSVYNQTAFVYREGKSYSRYIELAGGFTENADRERVYILKVDGTAVRPGGGFFGISWDKDSNRWEIGGQELLDPGDTIVVPERLERIAWMREIGNITQILFQIAVTAGVLLAI
jgi:protein involved in polysaccharide export with SLBB domain